MTESDRADELARKLLLLSVLAKRVAEAKDEIKAELAGLMRPGTMLRPQLDGRSAGSVSYTTGRGSAAVYSEREFTDWVRQTHPEYVHLQPVVDMEFRSKVLVVSEQAGVPLSPLGELDVAGVRASRGEPAITARPDRSRTAELWQEIRAAEVIGELDSESEMR